MCVWVGGCVTERQRAEPPIRFHSRRDSEVKPRKSPEDDTMGARRRVLLDLTHVTLTDETLVPNKLRQRYHPFTITEVLRREGLLVILHLRGGL